MCNSVFETQKNTPQTFNLLQHHWTPHFLPPQFLSAFLFPAGKNFEQWSMLQHQGTYSLLEKNGGRLQSATTSLLEPEWPGGWNTLKILRHGIKLKISVASLVQHFLFKSHTIHKWFSDWAAPGSHFGFHFSFDFPLLCSTKTQQRESSHNTVSKHALDIQAALQRHCAQILGFHEKRAQKGNNAGRCAGLCFINFAKLPIKKLRRCGRPCHEIGFGRMARIFL